MTHENDDAWLDRLLDGVDNSVTVERLQTVRRSILVAASNRQKKPGLLSFFSFEPAFLVATGLLGLLIGVSLPIPVVEHNGGSFMSDIQQPGLFEGDAYE